MDLPVTLGPAAICQPSCLAPYTAIAPLGDTQDQDSKVHAEQWLQNRACLSNGIESHKDIASTVDPTHLDHSLGARLMVPSETYGSLTFDNSQSSQNGASPPLARPAGISPEAVLTDSVGPCYKTVDKELGTLRSVKRIKPSAQFADSSLQTDTRRDTTEGYWGPQQFRALVPDKRRRHRKKGRACLLCGQDKVKCDATEILQPCSGCFKRASFSRTVAFRLCLEYADKAWEVRKGIESFRDSNRNIFQHILKDSTPKGLREIIICNTPAIFGSELRFSKDRIKIEIEEIDLNSAAELSQTLNQSTDSATLNSIMTAMTTSPLSASDPYLYGYLVVPSGLVEIKDPGSAVYRISERSLTSLRNYFVRWTLNDLCFRSQYPPETHQASLDLFLLSYARHHPPLTMARLVKRTLGLMAAARHVGYESVVQILDHESPDFNNNDIPAVAKLPKPAQSQIFGLALEKFQNLEALVLQEIDSLVFGKKSNRSWELASYCSDPLILGLCIRRMALWYRHMMFKYKHHGIVEDRGTLSPFDEDWKLEEHAIILGNNKDLIRKFEAFNLAEEDQCRFLDPEDDGVYLNLFVKKKNRKGKSMAKSIGMA